MVMVLAVVVICGQVNRVKQLSPNLGMGKKLFLKLMIL
ncbi:Uncharacterised protein [Salmonella bongori]|nr:Uncharacterised protein [Salmonella bongori]